MSSFQVLCISATNTKQLALEENAMLLFDSLATLREVSFGESTVKDQHMTMKGVVKFIRSQVSSDKMEKEDVCPCSFLRKKFDIKLLKINDTR